MGKIAFLFAGQGAQFSGMGADLSQSVEASRKMFEAADAIRPGTSTMCFEGTDEELRETQNTQPCMFAVEMAAAAALTQAGIHADMAAGFSLGELAALTYAGAMDFETGFRLVSRRGELMQIASEEQPTAMAAVMRLTNEDVERLCGQFHEIYPVNYNCPGQVSVSGLASEMPAFSAAVKEVGGKAIPLKVAGAFHTPFMQSAADALGKDMQQCTFHAPEIPTYSNYTGQLYGSNVPELLEKQICNPVLWEVIVRNMIEAGADTFIELGPGRTLCNLLKKIDSNVRGFGVSEGKDLETILAEVRV